MDKNGQDLESVTWTGLLWAPSLPTAPLTVLTLHSSHILQSVSPPSLCTPLDVLPSQGIHGIMSFSSVHETPWGSITSSGSRAGLHTSQTLQRHFIFADVSTNLVFLLIPALDTWCYTHQAVQARPLDSFIHPLVPYPHLINHRPVISYSALTPLPRLTSPTPLPGPELDPAGLNYTMAYSWDIPALTAPHLQSVLCTDFE